MLYGWPAVQTSVVLMSCDHPALGIVPHGAASPASAAEFKLDDVLPDQEREQQLEQVRAGAVWLHCTNMATLAGWGGWGCACGRLAVHRRAGTAGASPPNTHPRCPKASPTTHRTPPPFCSQIAALRKWLKGLPLSRRPLVKLSAQVAPEPAVKMLQARGWRSVGASAESAVCIAPTCGSMPAVLLQMNIGGQDHSLPSAATCRPRCRPAPRSSLLWSWRMWLPRCCCRPQVGALLRCAASTAAGLGPSRGWPLVADRGPPCCARSLASFGLHWAATLPPAASDIYSHHAFLPRPSPPGAEKGGMTAALAGGVFDIGDRVAAITGSGSPPFGSRGTVVGTYDDAVEVRRERWKACEVAGCCCYGSAIPAEF